MDLTLVVSGNREDRSPPLEGVPGLEGRGISFEIKPRLGDASGDYVLVSPPGRRLDADSFDRLWARRGEAEVVLGSRYLRGGGSEMSPVGALVTRLGNRALRQALRLPCHDPLSGVRLYERGALRAVEADGLDRWSSLELLVRLYNLGFKLRDAAYFEKGRRFGLSDAARVGSSLAEVPRLRKLRRSREAADADDFQPKGRLALRRRRIAIARMATIVSFLEVDVPVLDVGCGSSHLIQSLARGTGIDRDLRKLRYLRGRARAIVAGELPRLPFRDASFPQVVLSDVVSSLAEVPYLEELRRVLSGRGTLVLATGRSKRGEAEWTRELEQQGFAVDEVRRIAGAELVVRAVVRETHPPEHR